MLSIDQLNLQYVTNYAGQRSAVIVPIDQFYRLSKIWQIWRLSLSDTKNMPPATARPFTSPTNGCVGSVTCCLRSASRRTGFLGSAAHIAHPGDACCIEQLVIGCPQLTGEPLRQRKVETVIGRSRAAAEQSKRALPQRGWRRAEPDRYGSDRSGTWRPRPRPW